MYDECCRAYRSRNCAACPVGSAHVDWKELRRGYNCGLFNQPVDARVCEYPADAPQGVSKPIR